MSKAAGSGNGKPSKYPERPPYFAMRVIRLLVKTCAAQAIGQPATWLVTTVAVTEDGKYYSAPPTFYNEQLLPLLGLRKWEALDRARCAAVEAGWLHYHAPPAGSRRPGTYWTLIPDQFRELDHSPVGKTHYPPNGYGEGDGGGYGRGYGEGDGGGELPYLSLSLPLTQSNARALDNDHIGISFSEWYDLYPRKTARKRAEKAYRKAVEYIASEHGCSAEAATQKLMVAVRLFAESDIAKGDRRFIPHPATWLNDARYDDDPRDWERSNNGKSNTRGGNKQRSLANPNALFREDQDP